MIYILTALLIITVVLLVYEHKQRVMSEEEESRKDEMLTGYVAENIDLEKQLSDLIKVYDKQKEMSDEIKKMQVQSRLLKHDMKNHIMVILSYIEEEKIDEAKIYTSKILDNLNKMYTYINVGNSLLNNILNNKLSKAKEMGIEIKAQIENLAFEYMDSMDFSALLNNLLDNAIDGAEKSGIKQLEIVISNQKGFDSILVKNSIDKSVLKNNPHLKSSKEEEGHGFGIRQIKGITDKYNGMTDIYEKDGFFIINVVYPC